MTIRAVMARGGRTVDEVNTMGDKPATASDTWRMVVDLPSERGSNRLVTEPLLAQLGQFGWCESDVFAIHLAVEEAITNAIVHGNKLDPGKTVHVECEVSASRALVSIADEGRGFDPGSIPDCTADDRLDAPGGRGVMLMRAFMSRIEYNAKGNAVELEKRRG